MSDQFTETTTESWSGRILGSFWGAIAGLIMFVGSFFVLYMNEGRVDKSKIAKTAIEISSTTKAPATADGKLISATGIFKSDEKLGDTFLKQGDYIAIRRYVEMYAWSEKKSSKSKKNFGGSETTESTYTYTKKWTWLPANSSMFKKSKEHENPQMTLSNNVKRVKSAKLGIYDVDMHNVKLPFCGQGIQLDKGNVVLSDGVKLANSKYLFKGKGALDSPEIGDLRISYFAINDPLYPATIFGKLDSSSEMISLFYTKNDRKIYRVFEGTRDSAIALMHEEYKLFLWLFRLIGFLMMWIGLVFLLRPLSVFLDVVPFLGSLGMFGIFLSTLLVSLVASITTIVVSIIAHSLIALIVVMLALLGGVIWYLRGNKRKNFNI